MYVICFDSLENNIKWIKGESIRLGKNIFGVETVERLGFGP